MKFGIFLYIGLIISDVNNVHHEVICTFNIERISKKLAEQKFNKSIPSELGEINISSINLKFIKKLEKSNNVTFIQFSYIKVTLF